MLNDQLLFELKELPIQALVIHFVILKPAMVESKD